MKQYRQEEDASSRYRDANGKDRQVPASINEVAVGKERLGEKRVVVKGPKARQSNELHRKRRTDGYPGEEKTTAMHLYIGAVRGGSPSLCMSSHDPVPVHLGGQRQGATAVERDEAILYLGRRNRFGWVSSQ